MLNVLMLKPTLKTNGTYHINMNEQLKAILDRWGEETVTKMIQVLSEEDKIATSTLARSIRFTLGEDTVNFLMDSYGTYVESGTRDHYIPVSKYPGVATQFKNWASSKGISKMVTRYAKLEKSNKGYIHVNKQQPVKFFTTVIEQEIDKLVPVLGDKIIQYFGDRIKLLNEQA